MAKNVIPLAVFVITTAYFVVEAKDMLGGITDWVRKRNYQRGFADGKEEGRKEAEREIENKHARRTSKNQPTKS